MIKNKKGAMTGGIAILIVIGIVAVYMLNIGGIQDIELFKKQVTTDNGVTSRCPSSGLTEITLNAQEALASTATDSGVSYYVYDNGALVKEGETGADGAISFDLGCGVNKRYTMLVLNETAASGSYAQTVTIDASGPTDIHNLKTYEFGQMNIANIGSSSDPAEGSNVSGGAGKTCGFVITFANNETSSGYNKPLIMCEANTTSVTDININGVTKADAKKPTRITSTAGKQYHVFELDRMLLSTEGAVKLTGTIQFSASNAPDNSDGSDNMTCMIVDQAKYKKAEYKTLSLSDGWVTAAENAETVNNTGARDSQQTSLFYSSDGGYC